MKRTMTINLTETEMAVLERLCEEKGLSKTALVRQALRLYTSVDERLARGEKVFVESADKADKTELMVL
ncbi:Ribbon-helix-helix protein, copG family (plasmid) [Marinibacterium anthonyi]|nr:Ribbon-helix-helix protein, copG family [Marinibacterium anthonyi]